MLGRGDQSGLYSPGPLGNHLGQRPCLQLGRLPNKRDRHNRTWCQLHHAIRPRATVHYGGRHRSLHGAGLVFRSRHKPQQRRFRVIEISLTLYVALPTSCSQRSTGRVGKRATQMKMLRSEHLGEAKKIRRRRIRRKGELRM